MLTLSLIETLKTSIYNTKHTENSKLHFQKYIYSNIHIFQKNGHSKSSDVHVCFYDTFNILLIYIIIIVWVHSQVSSFSYAGGHCWISSFWTPLGKRLL